MSFSTIVKINNKLFEIPVEGSFEDLLLPLWIPDTAFDGRIKDLLDSETYNVLMNLLYEEDMSVCSLCESRGVNAKLAFHPLWKFDDNIKIQSLEGFSLLCYQCRLSLNWRKVLESSKEYSIIEHVSKNLDLNLKERKSLINLMKLNHAVRSNHTWYLDLSWMNRIQNNKKFDVEKIIK